jgi:glucose/arabinose dehydrogenase
MVKARPGIVGAHSDTGLSLTDRCRCDHIKIAPDYALGAHTASLGLCWSGNSKLPAPFRSGMFVGQHGSWNRRTRSGYKVVFVAFDHGQPQGLPIEVLGGFLNGACSRASRESSQTGPLNSQG